MFFLECLFFNQFDHIIKDQFAVTKIDIEFDRFFGAFLKPLGIKNFQNLVLVEHLEVFAIAMLHNVLGQVEVILKLNER